MKKFCENLKKNYPFLLNAVIPLLIFLLPVIKTNYIDDVDTISYVYNFYDFFKFSSDSFFASLNLLILISSIVNFILFIVYMFDSYKLILYKKSFNITLLIFSFVILIASIAILIYSIYLSTISASEIFVYNNKFHIGSIIMLIYAIIQTIIITIKFRKKTI